SSLPAGPAGAGARATQALSAQPASVAATARNQPRPKNRTRTGPDARTPGCAARNTRDRARGSPRIAQPDQPARIRRALSVGRLAFPVEVQLQRRGQPGHERDADPAAAAHGHLARILEVPEARLVVEELRREPG